MAVNLQKGQKISLKKSDGRKLTRLMVGLGWDAANKKKSGFFSTLFGTNESIDCDASVFMCRNGKYRGKEDLIYFGNLHHPSDCIKHMGDNLTGEGEGDDEQIFIDLDKMPAHYDKLIFVVNIYQAVTRKQHFGMIKNAYIHIIDPDTHEEFCRFNLSDDYTDMLSMIAGEVYKRGDEWKFNAVGMGTKDKDLRELGERFK
ncbi:MAG: TerD family protein [Selenomonadaceae bacterium]|nr:TerD family protein [Selenomonadaceae bacterium]MBQ3726364.1 TerD family protein [Selenomonadaceae bacterium]MBQ9496657.1 TerD family protein [Selenomonadaceae bacterium]